MARVLGLDPGERRVGVAVSNSARTMVFPRPFLANDDQMLDALARVVDEEDVEAIVVGRPLSMQGKSTASTEKADQFAEAVAARLPDVQLFRIDERLTTVSAQKRLHETGSSIAASRSRIDSAAAVVLLEHFLESHHA